MRDARLAKLSAEEQGSRDPQERSGVCCFSFPMETRASCSSSLAASSPASFSSRGDKTSDSNSRPHSAEAAYKAEIRDSSAALSSAWQLLKQTVAAAMPGRRERWRAAAGEGASVEFDSDQ